MGAGCYYTTGESKMTAAWVDIEKYCQKYETSDEAAYEDLSEMIDEKNKTLSVYRFYLDSTYHGDGILLLLENNDPTGLSLFNEARIYNSLISKFKNLGIPMRMATSGYTSKAI